MFRFGDPGGRVYQSLGTSYANLASYWTTANVGGTSTITLPTGGGRYGGTCLRFSPQNASTLTNVSKTLDAQATWGLAFAFRTSGFPGTQGLFMASIEDGGLAQVILQLNVDGSISVYRGNSGFGYGSFIYGTLLGTAATGIIANAWNHIELKTTIDPTTGTVGLWVNGSQKLNLTGQNTRTTSNSFANVVRIGLVGNSGNNGNLGSGSVWDFDDVIVYDGQSTDGAGNADITGPIGDCGLIWLPPSGAGSATQFTSNGGANYGQMIDAGGVDGDTTYVESSTVGNLDTYQISDLPGNVTAVKSILEVLYARKTDIGTRIMGAVIRTGGVNYPHATGIALSDNYAYQFRNWGLNPNTAATWTVSDVNGLEAGQKITS